MSSGFFKMLAPPIIRERLPAMPAEMPSSPIAAARLVRSYVAETLQLLRESIHMRRETLKTSVRKRIPTQAEVEALVAYVRALIFAMLWSVRVLADFLLGHMQGATPGEAATFLNVRLGNREQAVKASVGAIFEENVSEALKGLNGGLFGARRPSLGNANGFARLVLSFGLQRAFFK